VPIDDAIGGWALIFRLQGNGEMGMDGAIQKIRKRILSERVPLDEDLLKIVDAFPSHSFLKNPAGQNIYLYLTRYVKVLTEYYFDKSIDKVNILDWGCGKGHVTFLLRRFGAKLHSCDIKSDAEDSSFGQETPIIVNGNIDVDPLEHEYILPYKNGTMDVVLSFGVLEHVSYDYQSLLDINRILCNRGLFFCFNLPYRFAWTQNLSHAGGNYYHDRLYHKRQVKELLENSGFDLLDMWHRQLFPKNSIRYPQYHLFERVDQFFTEHTLLKYIATNIEFVASKRDEGRISHGD
jgi:SAM-dependent methyltransferase